MNRRAKRREQEQLVERKRAELSASIDAELEKVDVPEAVVVNEADVVQEEEQYSEHDGDTASEEDETIQLKRLRPDESDSSDDDREIQAENVSIEEEKPWKAVFDNQRQAWYYWHPKSGRVQWEVPEGMTADQCEVLDPKRTQVVGSSTSSALQKHNVASVGVESEILDPDSQTVRVDKAAFLATMRSIDLAKIQGAAEVDKMGKDRKRDPTSRHYTEAALNALSKRTTHQLGQYFDYNQYALQCGIQGGSQRVDLLNDGVLDRDQLQIRKEAQKKKKQQNHRQWLFTEEYIRKRKY